MSQNGSKPNDSFVMNLVPSPPTTMSTHSSTFDFRSYLQERTGYSSWIVEELTGGSANHTVRVSRPNKPLSDERTTLERVSHPLKWSFGSVVMKQAPPYLAKSPEFPFSPKRQVIEAEALRFLHAHTSVSDLFKRNPNIRAPKLVHHDPFSHVLMQSDLGSHPNLYDILTSPTTTTVVASRLGRIVGNFLVDLGESLQGLAPQELQALQARFQNDNSDQLLNDIIVQATDLLKEAEIPDASVLRRRVLEHSYRDQRAAFGQGDIWFGTILVELRAEGNPIVGLCDWEFAGPTGFANDVAQLGAYLHILSESPLVSPQMKENIIACAKEMYAAYLTVPRPSSFLRSLLIVHAWELLVAAGWKARQYLWCSCPGDGLKCHHIRHYALEGAQLLRAAGDLSTGPDYDALSQLAWFSRTGFVSGLEAHLEPLS
ncbi:hypothetical protein BDN72DRAFT_892567 [Pluteus cervinus]|uniref:Uncharacterized protein n=1 Tax=Pluteus cervinus TaxID=181527 RepID=A0ACD3BC43_9AGAR|nr:hypothetical protein BDN72DRAFT_892567 [Pluteus cervinus]